MKKTLFAVVVLALGLMIAAESYAYNRVYSKDLEDNGANNYVDVTCPAGKKLIGFAYYDYDNDAADIATVVCENGDKTHYVPRNKDWADTTNEVVKQICNRDEVVWGVSYKDRSNKDAMDGLRTICKNKKTGEIRYTYNQDTEGGPGYVDVVTDGKQIIGVSYKDGADGRTSDYADGATLILGTSSAMPKAKAASKKKSSETSAE